MTVRQAIFEKLMELGLGRAHEAAERAEAGSPTVRVEVELDPEPDDRKLLDRGDPRHLPPVRFTCRGPKGLASIPAPLEETIDEMRRLILIPIGQVV